MIRPRAHARLYDHVNTYTIASLRIVYESLTTAINNNTSAASPFSRLDSKISVDIASNNPVSYAATNVVLVKYNRPSAAVEAK